MTARPTIAEETGARRETPPEIGKLAFDEAADGMLVLDAGRVVAANAAASHMLGYDRDELIGRPLDALSADDPVYNRQRAAEQLAHDGPAAPRVFEWHYKTKKGGRRWAELSLRRAPLRGRNLSIVIARGISQRQTATRLAHRDSLTGLPNRWDFDLALSEASARHDRSGRPLSVAMGDVDHFKIINDSFGHAVGDAVLKGLARFMRARLRRVDYVARWGGDEFAFLLDADGEPAEILLNRLREGIAAFRSPAVDRVITLSFGVTAFRAADTPQSAAGRADRALYLSKQNGRNRTTRL